MESSQNPEIEIKDEPMELEVVQNADFHSPASHGDDSDSISEDSETSETSDSETGSIQFESDFKCQFCQKFFVSQTKLLKHQLRKHWVKFMCCFCTLTYSTKKALENHMKEEHNHIGIAPDSGNLCLLCNNVVFRKSYLLKHIERVHRIKCGECLGSFPLRSLFIQHFFEQHWVSGFEEETVKKPSIECEFCLKHLQGKSHFKDHLRRVHWDIKPEDISDSLGKYFVNEASKKLLKSKRRFNKRRRFPKAVKARCKICDRLLLSKSSNLKRHFEKQHPGMEIDLEFKCRECFEKFKTKNDVKTHYEVAHQILLLGESFEDSKPMNSKPCGKTRRKKPRKKMKNKPFRTSINAKCSICDLIFTTNYNIRRHFEKMHSEQGIEQLNIEYKCIPCQMVFETIYDFREHSFDLHEEKASLDQRCLQGGTSIFASQNKQKVRPSLKQKSSKLKLLKKPRQKYFMNAKCNECGKLFGSNFNLKRHFESAHPGLELCAEYKCKYCNEFFKTSEEARAHSDVHFTQSKNFTTHFLDLNSFKEPEQYSRTDEVEESLNGFEVEPSSICSNFKEEVLECLEEEGYSDLGVIQEDLSRVSQEAIIHPIVKVEAFSPSNEKVESLSHWNSQQEFIANPSSSKQHLISSLEIDQVSTSSNFQSKRSFIPKPSKHPTKKRRKRKGLKSKKYSKKIRLKVNVNAKCNVCKHLFNTNYNLRRHFANMHPSDELQIEYKCQFCEEFFPSAAEARTHAKEVHPNADFESCGDEDLTQDTSSFSSESEEPLSQYITKERALSPTILTFSKQDLNPSTTKERALSPTILTFSKQDLNPSTTKETALSQTILTFSKQDLNPSTTKETALSPTIVTFSSLSKQDLSLSTIKEGTLRPAPVKEYTLTFSRVPDETLIVLKENVIQQPAFESEVRSSQPNIEPFIPSNPTDIPKKRTVKRKPGLEKVNVNAKCNVCRRLFNTNYNLRRHFANMHPWAELQIEYKCQFCNEFFPTAAEARTHAKEVHRNADFEYLRYEDLTKQQFEFSGISQEDLGASQETSFSRVSQEALSPLTVKDESLSPSISSREAFESRTNLENVTPSNSNQALIMPDFSKSKQQLFCSLGLAQIPHSQPNEKLCVPQNLNVSKTTDEQFFKQKRRRGKFKRKLRLEKVNVNAKCNICKHLFNTNYNLRRHFANMHPSDELKIEYKCGTCDEFFPKAAEARLHEREKHRNTRYEIEGPNQNEQLEMTIKEEVPVDLDHQLETESENLNVISFSVFEIESEVDKS
ncbi:hypothetical protein ACFFRR_003468 [Megaselia abdita]